MTTLRVLPLLALLSVGSTPSVRSNPNRAAVGRRAAPAITSLAPTSAIVGSAGIRLTVNGNNFARTSVVRWNGTDRATTYVSGTQLTADIPSSDLVSVGSPQVTVFTQGGAGGTSNAIAFTVGNPVAVIASLNPSSTIAGGEPFNLVVTGSNFVSTSVVRWNGVARQTTFEGPTRLTASIPASDLANTGSPQVSVFNPAPLGGSSATLALPVTFARPVITSLDPTTAPFGTVTDLPITVNGQNFIRTSVVRWFGANRATTWVSPTQLKATLTAADRDSLVTGRVTVVVSLAGGTTRESDPATLELQYPKPSISDYSPYAIELIPGYSQPITLRGTGFTKKTVVTLNGHHLGGAPLTSNTWSSGYTVYPTDSAGPATITAENPTPGGGISTRTIPFRNRQALISSLNPQTSLVGGKAFTLAVTGHFFVPTMVVRWNGSERPTTYVSSTELRASIPATDLTKGGDQSITVFDKALLGRSSEAKPLTLLYQAIKIP